MAPARLENLQNTIRDLIEFEVGSWNLSLEWSYLFFLLSMRNRLIYIGVLSLAQNATVCRGL